MCGAVMCRNIEISSMITEFARFWFTADFYAVGLFAFGGVAMRVGIQNGLKGQVEIEPTENYGPFMQMFYAKPYLLCNLVGCFTMAFCMTHMLHISAKSQALYKGLTTGFCGSLTTFSGLMNGTINVLWDRHWYKYMLMLLIEFLLTWAAFTLGFACAEVLKELSAQAGLVRGQNKSPDSYGEVDMVQGPMHEAQFTTLDDADLSAPDLEPGQPSNRYKVTKLVSEGEGASKESLQRPTIGTASFAAKMKHNVQTVQHFLHRNEYRILATLLTTLCTVLWIILILEPQLTYFNNVKVRNTYRAIALAPLGAWTRWGLTRFPEFKNLWPEMHPQTMIANLVGVAFMCSLTVFSESSWVYAIDSGFNGSLTTVSTFFAELHNLYIEKGPAISLRYFITTVGLAIAIIEIIRASS